MCKNTFKLIVLIKGDKMRFDLMEEGVAYPKDHIFLYGFNVEKNGFYCIIRFKYIKRIKPITNLLNCKIGNGLACPTFF